MVIRAGIAVLLALGLAAAGAAQNPGQPAPGGPGEPSKSGFVIGEDEVVIATDEDKGIPLKEFIKLAEKVTGRVFMMGGPQMGGAGGAAGPNISLIGRMRIKKESFFAFFQTILRIMDYGIVRRGADDTAVYTVVNLKTTGREQLKSAVRFVPNTDLEKYSRDEGTMILTTLKLKYINANQANSTLRQLIQDSLTLNQINPIGDSNSLFIRGFGPWVWTMFQMIKLVDVPPDEDTPQIEIVKLQHASADELEPILTDLVGKGGPIQGARQNRNRGRRGNVVQPIEPKVIPEPRSNALIITASEDDMPLILNLVMKLDTPAEDIDGDYHVVQLVNALAKDVRKTLHDFLRESQQSQQQARRSGSSRSNYRELKPVVVADEKSNSLLITASKSRYAEILKIIERLDVRQPQVLIKAALVEVDVDKTFNFGTEIGLVDLAAEGTNYTRPFGFTNFGLSTFEDTNNDNVPDTRLPNFDNPPTGILGGIISGGDFSIPLLFNINKDDQVGNVLSVPSVLVNNNETAEVHSTEEVATQETNQGTATTSTGFQGYQEAGITMKISPSISESNYLKLNIELEVSRFVGTSSGGLPPNKVTRKIITMVTIPSGDTLVLGGVIQDDKNEGTTGVPFLKDIPILGWLFGSHSTDSKKVNLYFFVTPFIMDEKDFSDLREQSHQTKLEAQEYIGQDRIQIIDRKWVGGNTPAIEDPRVKAEDLEELGGFLLPEYETPKGGEVKPAKGTKAPKAAAPSTPEPAAKEGGNS